MGLDTRAGERDRSLLLPLDQPERFEREPPRELRVHEAPSVLLMARAPGMPSGREWVLGGFDGLGDREPGREAGMLRYEEEEDDEALAPPLDLSEHAGEGEVSCSCS